MIRMARTVATSEVKMLSFDPQYLSGLRQADYSMSSKDVRSAFASTFNGYLRRAACDSVQFGKPFFRLSFA